MGDSRISPIFYQISRRNRHLIEDLPDSTVLISSLVVGAIFASLTDSTGYSAAVRFLFFSISSFFITSLGLIWFFTHSETKYLWKFNADDATPKDAALKDAIATADPEVVSELRERVRARINALYQDTHKTKYFVNLDGTIETIKSDRPPIEINVDIPSLLHIRWYGGDKVEHIKESLKELQENWDDIQPEERIEILWWIVNQEQEDQQKRLDSTKDKNVGRRS